MAIDYSLSTAERSAIMRVLRVVEWNKAAAANLLGISRSTLYRKLEEHRLEGPCHASDTT